jgi:hypothetical protein
MPGRMMIEAISAAGVKILKMMTIRAIGEHFPG